VTSELKSEAENFESRRVLLERLGVTVHGAQEFPADWRALDIARVRAVKFGPADCELLRQLRVQVLSKLAVKVIAHDRSCSIQRLRSPTLKIAVLVPASAATIGRLER
jgi:hypothetical protein